MKGYWIILGTEVADQESQAEYGRLWAPISEKYRAKINPTEMPPVLMEARNTARVIIVEFATYDDAVACYEDPDYQKAKAFANKAAMRDLLVVRGEIV